jgi:autoinducer 2-degrading protein
MEQRTIHVFAKWQVKEGEVDTVLNLLTEVTSKSAAEEGNLFYKVHQNTSDANSLVLFEGYKDEAALEAHRNTTHFKMLVIGQIIPLLEAREVIITVPLF